MGRNLTALMLCTLDGIGIICLLRNGGAGLSLQRSIGAHFLLRFSTLALCPVDRGEKEVNGRFSWRILFRHQEIGQRVNLLTQPDQGSRAIRRSEEHTSELQSPMYL